MQFKLPKDPTGIATDIISPAYRLTGAEHLTDKYITNPLKEKRSAEREAEAAKKASEVDLKAQADLLSKTGVSELGAAQTAWDRQARASERDPVTGHYKGLEEGEYAGLDRAASIEKALAADFAGRMGISGGSLEYGMQKDIEENYRISEANALKEAKAQIFKEGEVHYQNAVTALGMSNTTLANLYKIHAQAAAEAGEAQQALLSTVAILTASYFGGIPGGMIASQALRPQIANFTTGSEGLQTVA